MRKLFKWLGIVVAVLLLLAGAGVLWVLATWDADYSAMPRPAITASTDPAVIARGDYLFNTLGHCPVCHGDPQALARQPAGRVPSSGGRVFHADPFGTFVARNLTADRETGLGANSDGDIARAIRSAVDRDGHFLPFMKLAVGAYADEDLTALVSYIRTFPPIRNQEAPEAWGFIAKYLAATRFKPAPQRPLPYVPASDAPNAARGGYLANGPGGCRYCHTPHDPMAGFVETGPPFSGGDVDADETDASFEIKAPNLTPDPTSSPIAAWDEDTFVTRFHGGRVFAGSPMPWERFTGVTEADVRSLYRYLKSLRPVPAVAQPTRRPAGWKPGAR
jgi:mono/diheme cytochrome c family protein